MRETRRARVGLSVILFLTGLIFASWAARIPAVKDGLSLGDGGLAAVLMAEHLGSVLGLQVGAMVVPRLGSRATLRVFLPLFSVALIPPALAGGMQSLAVCLVLFGILNSVVDVAVNSHGAAVEVRHGQPLFSGLHAMHSVGVIAGAGIGSLAAYAGLGTRPHFAVVALACLAGGAAAARLLFPSTVDMRRRPEPERAPAPRPKRWSAQLTTLGLLAFCCTLAEGSVGDWSSVFLRDELGASPGVAALGFGAFATMMVVGRFTGDRLRQRYGAVPAFRGALLCAAAGLLIGVIGQTPTAGMIGFTLLGAGLSYTLPTVLAAASRLPGQSAATSVARVATIGYLGFSVGPGLIGAAAQVVGLSAALVVPALLLLVTAAAARAVSVADRRVTAPDESVVA
ncbi:MFS transporter [Phytohabitans flavus]|uniref:MFS transporter n=1 Tax=Phytohabitans flavus TaxID=1076124 RepID=A0A6F8XS32_9ACTN|nr:MFS transporter [Phytohabitans flavus]BCB76626.1 MFS transporter [Phytohabitans flavus]